MSPRANHLRTVKSKNAKHEKPGDVPGMMRHGVQWCRCRCLPWRCTWGRWRPRARCTRRCWAACCARPPSASSTARPSAACSTASARTWTSSTMCCPWRCAVGPPASLRYATARDFERSQRPTRECTKKIKNKSFKSQLNSGNNEYDNNWL